MDSYETTKPPTVLDYGRAKPLGYRALQKLTRFYPITALPNTDMIRFIVNSQGYWDPYSSYLRITVNMATYDAVPPPQPGFPPPGFNLPLGSSTQLDNSGSSLIQTLSFIQNGVEIERIDRYEVLAGILNDMFYSREQRMQRAHEGFGTGLQETHTATQVQTGNNATTMWQICPDATPSLNAVKESYLYNTAQRSFGMPVIGCGACSSPNPSQESLTVSTISTPSPFFDGCNEPILWGNGTVQPPNNKMCYTYTFCIPIISGIFGVLVPADEIKYIPMQFFPNLEMNFRLNPYAFHSLNPASNNGRNFQVTACELFVNIIHFAPEINASVAQLVKENGLMIHTCSYYYGPAQMIQANANMETYPINMSFKSLRSIIWCFIPTTYRNYPYVREQRRKALNLQSAQVRIGGDTFPTFPIGNLGGTTDSSSPDTNADFLVNTFKAFGRLHDTVNDSLVNSHSFCAGNTMTLADYNDNCASFAAGQEWGTLVRGYQVDNSAGHQASGNAVVNTTNNNALSCSWGTASGGGTYNVNDYIFIDKSVNNYLMNQIVPRAVYGIDLDTITSDDSVISGINTLINKPFELLLNGMNNTPEACELNMFLYYDMVVMIDKDFTVKYLGRGG